MLIADIRRAVSDRWSSIIGATKHNRYIAAAVRYYSRFNPRVEDATFTTVSGTQVYNLTAQGITNCIGIQKVLYAPLGDVYNELKASSEILYLLTEPPRYQQPSIRVIDDINEEAHLDALHGAYSYRPATDELELWPEPTATGTTVYVTYYALHVINEGGTGYDTIPDQDLDIVRDLVLAEVLEGERWNLAMEPDYAEGLERQTAHYIPGNIENAVNDLRSRVEKKYGRGFLLLV